MTRDDYRYRVVVRGGPADEAFSAAVSAAPGLLLATGHGGGTVSPGGPLPEADTWAILVDATDSKEAERKVIDALSSLERPRFIASVEPFGDQD